MKIVCDNCATKYSIADEKVRGKVFKIRCKKCSHIIVVRGGEGATAASEPAGDAGFPAEEPAPAPRAAAGASLGTGEAVWHLVVDREQIGPLTREEVQAKFRAGEVDLETYAWREGFADWLRLGSIEDFRDLAGDGAAAAAPAEGATRRTDTADLFATAAAAPQDDAPAGGDLFGGHNSSNAPTGEAAMPAAAAASDMFSGGGNALFGAPQAQAAAPAPAARPSRTSSPGFSGGGGAAMAAEPAVDSGSQKMTGQRNENSVLFSLNNLQALASGSGSGGGGGGGGSSSKAASSPEPRPGFANSQTEGSGLIDIRAMAASTLSASPSGPSTGKSDEPSFAAPPLFSPMAAPILMPAPASGPPKWIWALLGVGVLAVLGIVVVGVLLLTKKSDPTPPPVVAAAVPPTVVGQPPTPPGQPPAVVPAPGTQPVVAPPGTKAEEPAKEEKHHSKGKTGKEPKAATPGTTQTTAPAQVVAPAAAPKKAGKKGGDELDDLLNSASPDKPAAKHSAPKEEPAANDNLPDQLGKSDIVAGMSKVKAKVADCYVQYKVPGMANVAVTIGKNGHVSSASVSGSFAGTPTGSCVEKAVKSASFPPVKGTPTSINYPFMLR